MDTEVPAGEVEDKMALHSWNGTEWDLVPGSQTLDEVGNTLTGSISGISSQGIYGVLPDIIPPESPTDLTVTTVGSNLSLNWTAPVDRTSDLASQTLYQSTNGGSTWDSGTPLLGSQATYSFAATLGVSYLFRITATDTRDNESGGVLGAGALNAPEFDGIESLTSVWPGVGKEEVTAGWSAATPVTGGAAVTYRGYISDLSMMQNFSSPSFVTDQLSHDLSTLITENGTYYVIVHALSEGVEDGNFVEMSIEAEHASASTSVPPDMWDFE